MYSMWKIMCFLNLKLYIHIALHQIHKIKFFLAASYDPFKIISAQNKETRGGTISPFHVRYRYQNLDLQFMHILRIIKFQCQILGVTQHSM